ncbi:hypothetical protein AB0T83_17195 [Fluviibacterium sp. DFM31]|uniref:Uncharacterized protein n=1 Tax=Meridianimarinicoccus marinus TaxID=3231483 RepID=A0ABV3LAC0_9RHOB
MADETKQLFLARQTYLRRRVIDASRLLPLLGLFLFLIPLLWDDVGSGREAFLAEKLLYMFAVWFSLVAVAAVLAFKLRPGDLNVPRGLEEVDREAETD